MMNKDKFAKNLIDKILDRVEELKVCTYWGEEGVLVRDIIQLINDEAKIDYKRYFAWRSFYQDRPTCKEINKRCYSCEEHWSKFEKKEHREHCLGNNETCDKFRIREF